MKENAFYPKKIEKGEELVSGVREKSSLRLPSVPGRHLKEAKEKLETGVPKAEIFKLTGQAADKLTRLEMKLKKELREAEDEQTKDEILDKLSECDDLAKILTVHIDDLVEQEGRISQQNRIEMTSDPIITDKMLEKKREYLANIKLNPDTGLQPLLRRIDEFVEESSTPEEKLSRAA